MLRRTTLAAAFLCAVTELCGVSARSAEPPAYEVYAVRYATLRKFSVSDLVQGADAKRTLDIAMTIWVLKGPAGKTVLVDSGFYHPRHLQVIASPILSGRTNRLSGSRSSPRT